MTDKTIQLITDVDAALNKLLAHDANVASQLISNSFYQIMMSMIKANGLQFAKPMHVRLPGMVTIVLYPPNMAPVDAVSNEVKH